MAPLDNTYVIRDLKGNRTGSGNSEKFLNASRNYAKKTKASVQRDLLEGRLAKELLRENQNIASLAAMLCQSQAKIRELQVMNAKSYPDTISAILGDEPGILVVPVGDAMLVKRCRMLLNYKVAWDYEINDTCYLFLPIHLEAEGLKFLELATRRVFNSSHRISCIDRPRQTYVRDKYGQYWEYELNVGFRKVKMRIESYFRDHVMLPRLASFNGRLLHYGKIAPHRVTLLQVLASQQDNLRDLTDMRERGKGSLVQGIFGAMEDVVSTLAETGETIFHVVTKGVIHLTNDTVLTAEGVGDSVASLFSVIGGPGNLGLYILDLLIIIYLVYKHVHDTRRE